MERSGKLHLVEGCATVVGCMSLLLAAGPHLAMASSPPQVTEVYAEQRADQGNRVYVHYKVSDPDGDRVSISLWLSTDGGATFPMQCTSVTGRVGANILPGPDDKYVWWDAVRDYPGHSGANYVMKVMAVEEP